MKLERWVMLFAVALAGQLLLAAVLFWPKGKSQGQGAHLVAVPISEITSIRLRDGEGKELALLRREERWYLDQTAGDGEAAAERVRHLLERLQTLTSDRLVSRTTASHTRLKVGKEWYNRRIELVAGEGKSTALYLGSGQGQSGLHVRLGNSDEVYFAPGLSVFDVPLDAMVWLKAEDPDKHIPAAPAAVPGEGLQEAPSSP